MSLAESSLGVLLKFRFLILRISSSSIARLEVLSTHVYICLKGFICLDNPSSTARLSLWHFPFDINPVFSIRRGGGYQCHIALIMECFENSSGLLISIAKEFHAVISWKRKGLFGFILFQLFRYKFVVMQISQLKYWRLYNNLIKK